MICRTPLPSGFITQMWNVPPPYAWKATRSPRGEKSGRAASSKGSVSCFPLPPEMPNDQSTPCTSMTMVRPSRETVAAELVASVTTTVVCEDEFANP